MPQLEGDRRGPFRRFDDLRPLVDGDLPPNADPEDLRWFLLRRELLARHAREEWRRAGAPLRRAGDRAT
jgi:hypothetical protein